MPLPLRWHVGCDRRSRAPPIASELSPARIGCSCRTGSRWTILPLRFRTCARLGISHVYLSPIYTARPESPHGYDIVDYGCINCELGGKPAWQRLCEALRIHGLGVVLDVVPNHMAADPMHNALWRQVLREGPSSAAASFFDIDWRPLTGLVRDKVLLPVLEEPYGQALTNGAVQLARDHDGLHIQCGGLRLPLSQMSAEPLESSPSLDEVVARINASPELLHHLLEEQHYRVAYWRPANDEINYRRFFGINELIATHAENEDVFARSHALDPAARRGGRR